MLAAGCEHVFTDKASGKLARRPELDNALRTARAGDQLVVTKLDRLGRSLFYGVVLHAWLRGRRRPRALLYASWGSLRSGSAGLTR